MQLILWRHAEAEDDAPSDLVRNLTPKGKKQAAHMSAWLHSQLQDEIVDWLIVSSPANRAQQTAAALGLPIVTFDSVAPDAPSTAVIAAADWPKSRRNVIVVGHQPTLGMVAARLINGVDGYVSIKKGAMWWFEGREREGKMQTILKSMATPDTVLQL
ncbi:MAG: histidine phosphatase family protein [Pseudomonadota bacterium]